MGVPADSAEENVSVSGAPPSASLVAARGGETDSSRSVRRAGADAAAGLADAGRARADQLLLA